MSTFAMHITKKHGEALDVAKREFQCDECAEIFDQRSDLRRHTETKHTSRRWNCYDCDYTSKNKPTLITHIVRKHAGYNYDHQCVDSEGNCVNCHEKRPPTGHIYHIGVCTGISTKAERFNRAE